MSPALATHTAPAVWSHAYAVAPGMQLRRLWERKDPSLVALEASEKLQHVREFLNSNEIGWTSGVQP